MERIRVNGRTLLRALAALVVLAVLALAGRADYNETVLTAMGRETRAAIEDYLGGGATETQIVEEYDRRRDYWDGLRQQ